MRKRALALVLVVACEGSEPEAVGVGYMRSSIEVDRGSLPLAIWYPSVTSESEVRMDALVPETDRGPYAELLEQSPAGCATRAMSLAMDGEAASGQYPLILLSHCHECLGVSGATLGRELAQRGAVVIAPDHVNNTLWDAQAGSGVQLGGEFLEVRGDDLREILDAVEQGEASVMADSIDLSSVGLVGHSFGAATVGWVAQRDPRVSAAVALAAPVSSPLLPGVDVAEIEVPVLLVVAEEDNSITALGNQLMEQNAEGLPEGSIKVLEDAGHWSVSDVVGLVPAFEAGCGDGVRQTDGEPFTYPDPSAMRTRTSEWVVEFFDGIVFTPEL